MVTHSLEPQRTIRASGTKAERRPECPRPIPHCRT
jgi:hypothetical protein